MKVIIKEREYDYVSDHPIGWKFSAGDDFKFPVEIGIYKCFIKRFEKKTLENISGWHLLENLEGRHEQNLPRIHDIISTQEKGRDIHYVFYEFIEGDTLDKLISKNVEVNLSRLTEDLFNALQSLHSKNYWFADFCEKNIFCEKSGRFLLVDLDSAQPISEAPDIDMFGNKEYWSLVFNFYKNILHRQNCQPSDIDGISLNYLQVIFLILRLKVYYSNKEKEYDELFYYLPSYLNDTSSSFNRLFNKIFQKRGLPLQANDIIEIKKLIEEKIINQQGSDVDIVATELSEPLMTNQIETVRSGPVINEFNVSNYAEKNGDDYLIESGTTFTLNWKVKNALDVELRKNGEFYQKLDTEKKSIALKETYDGKEKKIKYTLRASNSFSSTNRSLMITVIDMTRPDPIVDVYQSPVINEFKAGNYVERKGDVYVVEGGKTFTLNWNVKNALKIELYKNEDSFKVFNSGEKSIELKEVYDGKGKEIVYGLEASNNSIEMQRRSLTIKIISSVDEIVINEFKVSNYAEKNGEVYIVESGKTFVLSWNVKNSLNVELHKNGQLYKKISGGEKSIEVTEVAYDGKEKEIRYTLKASGDSSVIKSKSLTIIIKEAIPARPVINQFKASKYILRDGGSYTLKWEVQNASTVELYKNEELYRTFNRGEKSVELKENYDGKEKKIQYTLQASNASSETKSNPVIIFVKPPVNTWKILTVVLAGVILLFVLFYAVSRIIANGKVEVSPFTKNEISENDTITISGKNLPRNAGVVQVKFNDVEGKIIQQTKDSARIQVPAVVNATNKVQIIVYVNGDSFTVADSVFYKKSNHPDVTVVYPFQKTTIAENDLITILGKNIPQNEGSVQIKFNNVEGKITQQTKDSINVLVPKLEEKNEDVNIIVYSNGNPFTAAEHVVYKKRNLPYVVAVYPFRSNKITARGYITITGKNLPQNTGAIQVKFNNVEGVIIQQTKKSLYVQVPALTGANGVNIIVYVNGRAFTAASYISYNEGNRPPVVYPFTFKEITEGDIITISGENLPQSAEALWVQFNFVKGRTIQQTINNIRVQVPSLINNVRVEITVYVNQRPSRTINNVRYHARN